MRRHRHNLKPDQSLRLLAYLAERPALNPIYRFKQKLCYMSDSSLSVHRPYLLLKKHETRKQCQTLVPRFLRAVVELRQSGLASS